MTQSVDEAEGELQAIMAQAAGALTAEQRVDLQERLNAFSRTLPFGPEFGAVRRAADDTFDDLGRQVAEQVQDSIRRRSDQLAAQVREIGAVTRRANADAEAAQAAMVGRAVAGVTAIAEGLTALEASIRANDLLAAADKLEAAWAAVRQFRQDVGGVA